VFRFDHARRRLGRVVMAGGGMRLADLAAETFHAYVVCDEPDELFARAVKNGAVVAELNDKDYGSRDFAVLDPEGNHWSFGTYRGHPR